MTNAPAADSAGASGSSTGVSEIDGRWSRYRCATAVGTIGAGSALSPSR
jgi:hypothetical protein